MTTLPEPTSPSAPSPLRPVAPVERVSSVDTLRGLALLGILAMNILAFGFPLAAYMNPMLEGLDQGAYAGWNRVSWWIMHIVFDQKMMSIFSMLFGAGLVLMAGRAGGGGGAEATEGRAGRGFARRYYLRLFWLLVIGMIHAHLIWYGDILVGYALCGLLLYPLRRLAPKWLIIIGSVLFLAAVPVNGLLGGLMLLLRESAREIEDLVKAGATITDAQAEILKNYHKSLEMMAPTPEKLQANIAAMRGSLPEVLAENSKQAVEMQTLAFFLWTLWRASGLMLIGMGLMKLGVFAAALSAKAYVKLAMVGYGVGLPLVLIGAYLLEKHGFDMLLAFGIDGQFNYVGSLGVALGHVGVVMLVCKLGALPHVRARLAAVGRMALTNYLMQSILMTFVFFGWGLGWFAHVERGALYLFVLGVWVLELIWSPIWLSRFRFGPAEWLWRSLTYWKRQPMRLDAAPTPPGDGVRS